MRIGISWKNSLTACAHTSLTPESHRQLEANLNCRVSRAVPALPDAFGSTSQTSS